MTKKKLMLVSKFGGKQYSLVDWKYSDITLKRKANQLRGYGYLARVVPFSKGTIIPTTRGAFPAGRKGYALYVGKRRRK